MSPGGKYLAITRSPKSNVCDIEPDKEKRVEDETYYSSLTFINLDTMESRLISDGTPGKGIDLSGVSIDATPKPMPGMFAV